MNQPDSGASARNSAPAQLNADVLVVGGGINGVGIARDLAGRGLKVVLAERDDLAGHTSSASTKLIHGGLRYLEYYEFGLVRKSLAERELLLRAAPHIMRPLRFVMPHDPSMRPVWMIRLGLFLYDHLAKREWLPASGTLDLSSHPVGEPLHQRYTSGFVYSDGWVDDARLVVLNAIDAQAHGAQVFTRCPCVSIERQGGRWQAQLAPAGGAPITVDARAVVNAAGPWASQFLREHAMQPGARKLRLVKGSHVVVPKMFDHDHAYLFQNPDKRIIFAIPFERDFTLIGTTDVEVQGDAALARIDGDEIAYLCEQASRYFEQPVKPADVVWTYSGVRPLLDESGSASAVTRDYMLEFDQPAGGSGAPLLTVWGGKLTTFRKLAEEASDMLLKRLGEARPSWTGQKFFPGGDLSAFVGAAQRPDADMRRFIEVLAQRYPQLPAAVRERWAHAYGSRITLLLGEVGGAGGPPLGEQVAPGVFEVELHYLHAHEWARSADDVLWRRSKLGLHLGAAEREAVARWWAAHYPDAVPATAAEATCS